MQLNVEPVERVPTKVSRAAQARRLAAKRRLARKKKERAAPSADDD